MENGEWKTLELCERAALRLGDIIGFDRKMGKWYQKNKITMS